MSEMVHLKIFVNETLPKLAGHEAKPNKSDKLISFSSSNM